MPRDAAQDPDLARVRRLATSRRADVRRRALGELFERHQKRVFRVALRILGDWTAAQDLVQEVFLSLAARARTYRGDAPFTAWLYRLTVNLALDSRRRDARRKDRAVGIDPGQESGLDVGATAPAEDDEALDRDQAAREVQAALMLLSPKNRAILVLRYVEGLPHEHLAQVLGLPPGTVKSRLSRAQDALEKAMSARGIRKPAPGSLARKRDGPPRRK